MDISRAMKRVDLRRLPHGIQIGALRIFWDRSNWRSRTHPYWFTHRGNTMTILQSGPFELWYHKKDSDPLCVCGVELSLHPQGPLHNFVNADEYYRKHDGV